MTSEKYRYSFTFSEFGFSLAKPYTNLKDAVIDMLNSSRASEALLSGQQLESITIRYGDLWDKEIHVKENIIADILTFYRRLFITETSIPVSEHADLDIENK